ncbi:hypothetical protein IWQ61_000853 [Dispira simplex]|nr:hypothetical protein IWQ61_000853 [Dispira simplex]
MVAKNRPPPDPTPAPYPPMVPCPEPCTLSPTKCHQLLLQLPGDHHTPRGIMPTLDRLPQYLSKEMDILGIWCPRLPCHQTPHPLFPQDGPPTHTNPQPGPPPLDSPSTPRMAPHPGLR